MHVPLAWFLVVAQAATAPAEPFSSPVALGAEVRFSAGIPTQQAVQGRVVAQDEGGLTVTRAVDGERVTVAWAEVHDLEIARHRIRRFTAEGAVAGLVLGAALGATCKDDDEPSDEPPTLGWSFNFDLDLCPYLVPRLVAASTVVGGLIGTLIRRENRRWERAHHPRLTANLAPTRGRGAAIAVTLHF
jgi:hypothetical protein